MALEIVPSEGSAEGGLSLQEARAIKANGERDGGNAR